MPVPNLPFDINAIGQLLNNVDINSMSNTLKNMDINQVVSILSKALNPSTNASVNNIPSNAGNSSPNVPPNNIPNNAPNTAPNNTPVTEYSNPLKDFNIPDFNQMNKTSTQSPLNPVLPPNDPTVMILNSLKPFLPPDKCKVIDNMIQVYGIKTVIDKIFPPSVQTNNLKVKNNFDGTKSEEQLNDKPESL
jgi:hypothetical protein